MSHLSEELKNYYKKSGNKINFPGGYTLNSLSLAIWEKLGFQNMDPAMFSRIINGKRIFSLEQLYAFTDILKLNTEQRNRLLFTLQMDVLEKAGFNNNLYLQSTNHKLIDLFFNLPKYFLHIINNLRNTGFPQYTIELVSILVNLTDSVRNDYPNEWEKNKKIIARLYNERARAFGETTLPNRVLKLMIPDTLKAIEIGETTNNKDILNMSYMNIGGAYYVAKQWRHSAEYLENHLKKVDLNTQIEFLRTTMLDYAFLNDYINFKRIRTVGLSKIEEKQSGNKFHIISFLEALGRSTALFGHLKEARKVINEAEILCNKESMKYKLRKPFFDSQILRGKLFILSRSKKIDKEEILSIINRSLNPQNLVYERHIKQINEMLKRINITKYAI